jgi:mevalonate kinase
MVHLWPILCICYLALAFLFFKSYYSNMIIYKECLKMETNKKFSINSTAEIKRGITKVATISCLVNDILYEYIKEHDKVFGVGL